MAGGDAVTPSRRPRAFAPVLGGMVAEQACPRGRPISWRQIKNRIPLDLARLQATNEP